MFRLMLLVFAYVTVGCATLKSSPENETKVPNERIYLLAENKLNSSILHVSRDGSLSGSACYYAIYVDDVLLARIGVLESLTVSLQSGQHEIKVTRDPQGSGLCSLGDDQTVQNYVLAPGQTKRVLISMDFGGSPQLHSP